MEEVVIEFCSIRNMRYLLSSFEMKDEMKEEKRTLSSLPALSKLGSNSSN